MTCQLTNSFIAYVLNAVSSVFFIANFSACYVSVCVCVLLQNKKAIKAETYFIPMRNELFRIGTCCVTFGFTIVGLHFSVNMTRPFCSLEPSQFAIVANTELERCLSSFPSAHTELSILVLFDSKIT